MSSPTPGFPGPIAKPVFVATLASFLGVFLLIVEVGLGSNSVGTVLLCSGVPSIAGIVMTWSLAKRRAAMTVTVLVFASLIHTLTGMCVAGAGYGLLGATIGFATACGFGIMFLPMWIAALCVGARPDLEAGDALVGLGGGWIAAVHVIAMLLVGESERAVLLVPGVVLGLVAIAVWAARFRSRRAWCARVVRGEVDGFRARDIESGELGLLPPIYGTSHDARCVIERLDSAQTAYRDARIAVPLAVAPLLACS